MGLNVNMGGLWEDFITIFWIGNFLQKPIYVWNIMSKHIMFHCGMDFNLSLTYNV